LCTKTDVQVRTFFVNYRRKYNLDNILKEYEQEAESKQQIKQQEQQQKTTALQPTIVDTETNKEQKPPNGDSTNAGDLGNHLSTDNDVMEVKQK
jgi:hypothetical protein